MLSLQSPLKAGAGAGADGARRSQRLQGKVAAAAAARDRYAFGGLGDHLVASAKLRPKTPTGDFAGDF